MAEGPGEREGPVHDHRQAVGAPAAPDRAPDGFRGRKRRRAALGLLLASLLAGSGLAAASGPEIYFYPPPYALPDGSLLASPQTVEARQITTDFPAVPEMAGVSLLVYWSRLCFDSDARCDLKIIDDTLAYWRARKKKVVLGVATIGFPVKSFREGAAHFENATPAWALKDGGTYAFRTRTLGAVGAERETDAPFPRFWDPHFLTDVKRLVDHLKKYDGDPALAQIRIGTGLMTEDNPMVGHLNAPMPGYSEQQWLDYCRAVFRIYRNAFKRTQLEFDIGRLGVAYGRGTPEFRAGVDAFFAELKAAHVFLAYNGLRDSDLSQMRRGDDWAGPSFALHHVEDSVEAGIGGGLEGAPLTSQWGGDVAAMAKVVRETHVTRLTLWGTEAGLLQYSRNAETAENRTVLQFAQRVGLQESLKKVKDLFSALGYDPGDARLK